METKLYIVVNQNAGNQQGKALLDGLQLAANADEQLRQMITGIVSTRKTDGKEVEWLRQAAEDANLILICGGDGTLHMVLNGLMKFGYGGKVAVYPLGTGNDLARVIGFPRVPIADFVKKIMLNPSYIKLDRFCLNGEIYFSNYISFGYDAAVVQLLDKTLHRLGSSFLRRLPFFKKLLFILLGLYTFITYRRQVQLEPSGNRYLGIIISNINSYAGGSAISENSSMEDGKLEQIFIKSAADYLRLISNRMKLFGAVPFDVLAETVNLPIKLRVGQRQNLQVDGEDMTERYRNSEEFIITHDGSWVVCR